MRPVEVRQHVRIGRVIGFVAVAVAFSWVQWFAVIASQRGWIAARISLSPLPIFGPFVAAVVSLIGASDDRERWLRSMFRWRIRPLTGVVAVFLPPILFLGCLAVATAVTPRAPRVPMPAAVTIVSLAAGMFITAGLGEESGWRGFLLPELRRSISPLGASSIVAVVWFVWHLPLYGVVGATQQQIPVLSFALGICSYSVILTWLVEGSNNSTLVAMLFHSSANVSFWLAMVYVKNLPQYGLLSRAYVTAIALAGAVTAVLLMRRDRKLDSTNEVDAARHRSSSR